MMGKLRFAKLHILMIKISITLQSLFLIHCKMLFLHHRVISKEEFLGEPALKSPSRRGSYVEKEAKAEGEREGIFRYIYHIFITRVS